MFTGIVQELGTVERIERSGGIYRLGIRSGNIHKDAGIGDSVSVNGACLTVVSRKGDVLNFDVMAETIRSTGLAGLKPGDRVNLEGSLKANGTLGGHFVLGHIDCVGVIKDIIRTGGEFTLRIGIPDGFDHLIVDKGSISIDGVSLTVGRADSNTFDVHIIPHTLKSTTLGIKKSGDTVNLEFDILGKYIAKARDTAGRSRISEKFLRNNGF